MQFVTFLFISIICCGHINAARILIVIPTPSISHQVVFRPLVLELAKRGHEVVVVTTDPEFPKGKAPPNVTEIDLHEKSYAMWRSKILTGDTTSGKSNDLITQMGKIFPLLSDIFEMQMQTEEMQNLIQNRSKDFDLLFVEACVSSTISLSHVFKVPVIVVSSLAGFARNYRAFGVPVYPVLMYPNFLRQRIFDLSFLEKIIEIYNTYLLEKIYSEVEEKDNKIIKKLFGPDTPTISELENNVQMLFLNIHPLWDLNRPVPPSVIYMGGIHQKPVRELPRDLKSYLDGSKHGVIYISFGTNVSPSSLPPLKIQLLVRTFARLALDVLWKWDADQLPGASDNIRISKWLPQSDLLRHPNVKLFITQAGLQSTDEAITAGVPMICMPMLADQWFNSEQIVHNGIGLRLDLESLNEDKLLQSINTVIHNQSYRKNIVRLRGIMLDQPQRPLARAVWWTEHVLRHGGAQHLRARLANISWAEYLDAQLMAALAALILIVPSIMAVATYLLVIIVKKYVLKSNNVKLKMN